MKVSPAATRKESPSVSVKPLASRTAVPALPVVPPLMLVLQVSLASRVTLVIGPVGAAVLVIVPPEISPEGMLEPLVFVKPEEVGAVEVELELVLEVAELLLLAVFLLVLVVELLVVVLELPPLFVAPLSLSIFLCL